MATYEKQQQHLWKLFEESGGYRDSDEKETADDESDGDEQDFVETINHDSESEQEISDVEDDNVSNSSSLSFVGKTA